ncbi:oxidoreductase [Pyxidicoccus caerfyrddinensis]|uniref:oxidoreductase n=1 Tax=Pyxidicoccus caerfyrddinensis TaxID=2709663 RepID=UPI0013DAB0C3|nr:oxidoreductase [Pyxidicoccus caerfyrddinensis]
MKTDWSTRDIPRLEGKKAIVTGANSGIGYFTALELGRAGVEVLVGCRDVQKGQAAVERMRAEVPGARFSLEALDLASLASVRAFAERARAAMPTLDLLVNNAGLMAVPKRQTTVDGFEVQFGTNHLGHFALTGLLMPALGASRSPRVVTVSSTAAYWGRLDLTNLQSEKRYSPMGTYGNSKLANLLFMLELDRRFGGMGLLSVAAEPGASATGLQKQDLVARLTKLIGQSAAEGALPSLYAATMPDVKGGDYFHPGRRFGLVGPPAPSKFPKRARDTAMARVLWEASERLTGVSYPVLAKAA